MAAAWAFIAIAACPSLLGASDAGWPYRPARPIEARERRAIELAIAYQAGGPDAWLHELSADGPLGQLPPEVARAEIAARVGPAAGTTWILYTGDSNLGDVSFGLEYPSGLEETVTLTFEDQLRLRNVTCLLDALPRNSPLDRVAHRLAPLASLRAALASAAPVDREKLAAGIPPDLAVEGQTLLAANDVMRHQLGQARRILDAIPATARIPLPALLRARLALAGDLFDRASASSLYEKAIALAPRYDGLALEAAWAALATGDVERASAFLRGPVESGSRLAEVHYLYTSLGLGNRHDVVAALRTAWNLEPLLRAQLFTDPGLTRAAADPSLLQFFAFGADSEPQVLDVLPAMVPRLELPGRAAARIVGSLLTVTLTGGPAASELILPGAASLAPVGTPVESAVDAQARRELQALARLGELLGERVGSNASAVNPHRRRQAEETAFALARHSRWSDLLRLTEGLNGSELAATGLIRLRAQALLATRQVRAARSLLMALAQQEVTLDQRNAGTLRDLAELCAKSGEIDLAVKLMKKARDLWMTASSPRERQFQAEARLLADGQRVASKTFDLLYPRTTGTAYPQRLATVLEAERQRIASLVPEAQPLPRIEVHLFDVDEFMRNYSADGVPVVGIYDGKVRVPLADVRALDPATISIVSHEVTHAMITERTHDQAPHWFQEGVAQQVEALRVDNTIPGLLDANRFLALSLLEDVLDGFAEAQFVAAAYSESAWFVRFLQARYGDGTIGRLLEAFARGATTDEALRQVCGSSTVELDRAFRTWATTKAPLSWAPASVRRYDQEDAPELAPLASESGRQPVKRPPETTDAPKAAIKVPAQAPDEQALRTWHAIYAARSAAVKQALAPVLGIYRHNETANANVACTALQASLTTLRADPTALRAPLPKVAAALATAYQGIGEAAQACRQGHSEDVRRLLDSIEAALGNAASELAPYGLRP